VVYGTEAEADRSQTLRRRMPFPYRVLERWEACESFKLP
jgi:hypothetical protein